MTIKSPEQMAADAIDNAISLCDLVNERFAKYGAVPKYMAVHAKTTRDGLVELKKGQTKDIEKEIQSILTCVYSDMKTAVEADLRRILGRCNDR